MSWGVWCRGKIPCPGGERVVQGSVSRYGAEVKDHVLWGKGCTGKCVQRGSKINVLGGVWCRGFMSWGDTLILVISRSVQLYYGIAQWRHVKDSVVAIRSKAISPCKYFRHCTDHIDNMPSHSADGTESIATDLQSLSH